MVTHIQTPPPLPPQNIPTGFKIPKQNSCAIGRGTPYQNENELATQAYETSFKVTG